MAQQLLPETKKILATFGRQSTQAMSKKAAKFSASGNMASSFRYTVTPEGLTIYGVNYLQWAETGRGKTKTKTPSEPTLKEQILAWIKYKRIPLFRGRKGRFISHETMAFLIARKIHREGTVLKRTKGFRDIYSSVINDKTVTELIDKLYVHHTVSVSSDIIKTLNTLTNKSTAA